MKHKILKSVLLVLLVALFGYFIQKNIGVIRETYQITTRHMTGYLLLAAAFSVISELIITGVYKALFAQLSIFRRFSKMLALHLSGIAVSIIIPSGGFASALVYADDAKKEEPRAAAITGFLLAGIADYSAVSTLLIFAMLYLSGVGGLGLSVFIPALIFLGLTLFLYFLVWISANGLGLAERVFTKIIGFVASILTRFSRKKINAKEAAESFLVEFSQASKYIFQNKKDWLLTIGGMILSHVARIAVLYIIFLSLGSEPTYRALVTGYAIGTLFVVISPTPSGVGFVEGAMVLSYTSLGVPAALATTAVLIYRGLVFWVPFFIGFGLLQGSRIRRIREDALELDID